MVYGREDKVSPDAFQLIGTYPITNYADDAGTVDFTISVPEATFRDFYENTLAFGAGDAGHNKDVQFATVVVDFAGNESTMDAYGTTTRLNLKAVDEFDMLNVRAETEYQPGYYNVSNLNGAGTSDDLQAAFGGSPNPVAGGTVGASGQYTSAEVELMFAAAYMKNRTDLLTGATEFYYGLFESLDEWIILFAYDNGSYTVLQIDMTARHDLDDADPYAEF